MADSEIQVRNELLEFRVLAYIVASSRGRRVHHYVYGIYRWLIGDDLDHPTLRRSAVCTAVARLEAKGWIARCEGEPHAQLPQGRRKCYTVTEAGEAVFRQCAPMMSLFGENLIRDVNDGLKALGDIPDDN